MDHKQALAHVLWIGGATDAGKTTVAEIIAERHGLHYYNYDRHGRKHQKKLDKRFAYSRKWSNQSNDERWVQTTPAELVQLVIRFFQDRFPMVVEDLMALPKEPIILAEGFGFTPKLVAPLLSSQRQAIWLVSSAEFKWFSMKQREKYTRRLEWRDPERGINNLFERDMLLAARVESQVAARGFTLHEVDGSRSVDEMVAIVEHHFEPFLR